ncbi:hypothetical protein ACFL2Q_11195 [Thermodesulfobacteriota bacterium]
MNQPEESEQIEQELGEIRTNIATISVNMGKTMRIWGDYIKRHGEEHTQLVETLQALASQLKSVVQRMEKLERDRSD